MKFKFFNRTLAFVAGASLLASMGTAGAAVREINIWGASAQFYLWHSISPTFLADSTADGGAGCASVTGPYLNNAALASANQGTVLGTNCGLVGGDDIRIRYAAKASYDGIWALKGIKDPEDSSACTNATDRKMSNDVLSGGIISGTTCRKVTLGASDVPGDTFTQESHGNKYGKYNRSSPGTNPYIDRVFDGFTLPQVNPSGLSVYKPLVVPFGFFVNNAVTVRRCSGGFNDGDVCDSNDDCNSGSCGAAAPLDNISRLMAIQIFTGQIVNWRDFGAGFANFPIISCFRHAGSGTHTTIDYTVMGKLGWMSSSMAAYENDGYPGADAKYFHDSTGQLMDCISGNYDAGGTRAAGAIGYADADRATNLPTNVVRMKYNGHNATRTNIRSGLYDFWTIQHLYENPLAPEFALTNPIAVKLAAYGNNPHRISGLPDNKSWFWASVNEMEVWRDQFDAYPYGVPAKQFCWHPGFANDGIVCDTTPTECTFNGGICQYLNP